MTNVAIVASVVNLVLDAVLSEDRYSVALRVTIVASVVNLVLDAVLSEDRYSAALRVTIVASVVNLVQQTTWLAAWRSG